MGVSQMVVSPAAQASFCQLAGEAIRVYSSLLNLRFGQPKHLLSRNSLANFVMCIFQSPGLYGKNGNFQTRHIQFTIYSTL